MLKYHDAMENLLQTMEEIRKTRTVTDDDITPHTEWVVLIMKELVPISYGKFRVQKLYRAAALIILALISDSRLR